MLPRKPAVFYGLSFVAMARIFIASLDKLDYRDGRSSISVDLICLTAL